MANLQKAVAIGCAVNADGINSTFQIDLLKDPYFITFQGNGFGEFPADWFSENLLRNLPVGVITNNSDSATLSNNVVTYTYATTPSAGILAASFVLLF